MQRVELFNTLGQCVLTHEVVQSEYAEISLVELPADVYLLRVLKDGGSFSVQKVVKSQR